MIVAFIVCTINGWGILIGLSFQRVIKTAFGAWLGFFAIGLVLWGIYTGRFSPTEAAGVTVGFCVFVGLLCYPLNKIMGSADDVPINEKSFLSMFVVEGFTLMNLPSIVSRSAQIAGILVPLIAISVAMQQVLSSLGAKEYIGAFVTGMGGYYAVLFTAMAIVFVTGMILESLPVTIILAPILAPIAVSVGVDPIHFAVVFLVGASIGFITPPYGLNLYVASGVTGVPYFRLLKYSTMYLAALISVWLLIALVPEISLIMLPER
jgi:TRAP-type C4-dicarboxylate transport system permease large subunit